MSSHHDHLEENRKPRRPNSPLDADALAHTDAENCTASACLLEGASGASAPEETIPVVEPPTPPAPDSHEAQPPRATPWKWGVLAALTIAGAGALYGSATASRVAAQRALVAESAAESTRRVAVVHPRTSAQVDDLTLPGTTAPIEEATIFARTSGYLRRTLVDIGDHVEAGQLLAEIDSPEADRELAEARARLVEARANLELARANLRRLEAVPDPRAISRQDLDDKQARVNTAEAAMRVGEEAVAQSETQASYERVVAPFPGVITARRVDRGALITAGSGSAVTSLFALARTDTLRVFVAVPQSDYAAISVGQRADVLLAERPGEAFAGAVVRTAGALDTASRTLRTEVHVPNRQGRLTAGLYVQVRFAMSRATQPLLVPAPAILAGADGARVATVSGDGTLHLAPVTLGRDLGKQVEVVHGLSADDRIVSNPPDDLKDGEQVLASAPAAD